MRPIRTRLRLGPRRALAALGLVLALVLSACGGGSSGSSGGSAGGSPYGGGSVQRPAPTPATNATRAAAIPQGNGGDHDGDNNGGPSDGDGNV